MESERPAELTRREILDLAGAVLGCAVKIAERLPRKGKTLPQHYAILCYTELLQDATACFLLMEKSIWGSAYKLMRPIVESYLHVISIIQDEQYINEVIFQACDSLEKDVKRHEKKYFSATLTMSDAEIVKCRDTISGYKALIRPDWTKRKTIEQYKAAGIEQFYVNSYPQYSRAVHGNFLALLNSHAIGDDYQGVVVIKEIENVEFCTVVGEFVQILQDTALKTMSYFGFEPDQETEKCIRVFVGALSCLYKELKIVVEPTLC